MIIFQNILSFILIFILVIFYIFFYIKILIIFIIILMQPNIKSLSDSNITNSILSLINTYDLSLYDIICDYLDFVHLFIDNIDKPTYNNYVRSNNKFNNIIYEEFIRIKYLYQTSNKPIINIIDGLFNNIKTNKLLKKKLTNTPLIHTDDSIIKLLINSLSTYDINYQIDKIVILYSGLGSIMKYLIKNKLSTTNIEGYDPNDKFNYIHKKKLQIITNTNYDNQIHTNDILTDNLNIQPAKLILCDIPDNIKNIIHAKCSNNIKQLKIRGTKSEPLIIQLITTLLARSGIAGVIIADSFLYNDSVQHIETRKYLMAKFTISKIINLINIKKSILIFKNSGPTDNILMHNLLNDQIIDLNISNLNKDYSLYFYHYDKNNSKIINKSNILSTYIDISQILPPVSNQNDILFISKYNQLHIKKLTEIDTFDYVFISRDEQIIRQQYLNHYIKQLLEKYTNNLVKGKIRQYDIQLINNLSLNIPPFEIQDQIISHLNFTRQHLLDYQLSIDNLKLLKKNYIKSIITDRPLTQLKNIINIEYRSNYINCIKINRNSNLVGKVNLISIIEEESTNYYYLHVIDSLDYNALFQILNYYEDDLSKLSNLNSTNQLSRNNLEQLEIPILSNQLIDQILKSNIFDLQIEQLYKKIALTNQDILNLFIN